MGEADAGSSGNIEGIDAEALMGQIERGQPIESNQATPPATPPSSQPAPQPAQSGPTPAPAAPADPEVDLVIDGQTFKAPMSRVKQWASQGRNYAQLVEKFNAKQAEFDKNYKTYADIDKYAQTPEGAAWWKATQEAYQQKLSQAGQDPSASPALPPEVKAQLDQLTEFKSRFESEQANKALDAEVQDIRKEYPNLSWETLDDSGTSLEQRVYDHALKNGIQSFKTAFRDLMHDSIIKYREDQAKERAVKELQAQRKGGLMGVTTTPQRQPDAGPKKFESYDDAATAALQEYGVG